MISPARGEKGETGDEAKELRKKVPTASNQSKRAAQTPPVRRSLTNTNQWRETLKQEASDSALRLTDDKGRVFVDKQEGGDGGKESSNNTAAQAMQGGTIATAAADEAEYSDESLLPWLRDKERVESMAATMVPQPLQDYLASESFKGQCREQFAALDSNGDGEWSMDGPHFPACPPSEVTMDMEI